MSVAHDRTYLLIVLLSAIGAAIARVLLLGDWRWGEVIGFSIAFAFSILFLAGLLVLLLALVGFRVVIALSILVLTFLIWHFERTKTFEWEERIGAIAADGFHSNSTSSGTASHHGGVARWLTNHHARSLNQSERYYALFDEYGLALLFLTSLPAAIIYRLMEIRNSKA
jgi:hypothetical protein